MTVAKLLKDFSLSSLTAGFITVLVGYTSSVALIFQATQALQATPAQTASWLWALGLGMGITCIALSLWYKQPVVTAWSTPGAAVIAAAANASPSLRMSEAIGAFIVCALLILIVGVTGWFERVMRRIPAALASALLAGVLARFAMDAFLSLKTQLVMVLAMFITYLIVKRSHARYAVVAVLAVGTLIAALQGSLNMQHFAWSLATPEFMMPRFELSAIISLAIPLFVVTMAGQNMAGYAVQRAQGYDTPLSPTITSTGLVTLLLAPFGAYALNLAAITAAICMDAHAHPDKTKRYTAAVAAGIFYVLLGVFGAAVAGLLAAFPKELVLAVAGFALLGSIGGGLATAMKEEGTNGSTREAALVTFLVTLSGLTLWGVGSAFWGVVAGVMVISVNYRAR